MAGWYNALGEELYRQPKKAVSLFAKKMYRKIDSDIAPTANLSGHAVSPRRLSPIGQGSHSQRQPHTLSWRSGNIYSGHDISKIYVE